MRLSGSVIDLDPRVVERRQLNGLRSRGESERREMERTNREQRRHKAKSTPAANEPVDGHGKKTADKWNQ